MSKRKDDPSQRQLEWTTRRGMELKALRQLDLNDPYAKLILLVLDLSINQEVGYWDLTFDEVRRTCNMSRSTFYDRVKRLQRLELISIQTLPNSDKSRWRIYRGTLARMATNPVANPVREAESVPVADFSVRLPDNTVRDTDDSVRLPDGSVRDTDCTTYWESEPTEPSAPSERESPSATTGWDEVIQELVAADVERWDSAIEALQKHVSPAHALQLCRHFRERSAAAKWQPVTLYYRCLRARENIDPTVNWPSQSAPAAPDRQQSVADLETRFGSRLNAMPPEELRQFVHRHGSSTLKAQYESFGDRSMRTSLQTREALLKLISENQS